MAKRTGKDMLAPSLTESDPKPTSAANFLL
jgi:hypothetical protein